jgi:serine/threonine protein kinase/Tfp pilus assembly protein PilF
VATTPAKRACSVCGTLLADDSPYCPVCALQQAFGTQSYSDSNSSSELRFEHYTVLQNAEGKPLELGRGAMGVTYKAFDVHLQCPVALKIINAKLFADSSARLRFVREARAAASVRHPNVASVLHLGESGGNYFYAMEFVDGETLEALIRRSGCLETDLALEIVGQVAMGLVAIEKQHLVHRDIKPSNIMVSLQDGKVENVKIIDLGLAKGVAEENTVSTLGAFIGTPAYASPEQFAGIATDIRSDLYSLGITVWEMLSGKLPYGGSAPELMYQHQHAALPTEKLRSIPASIIALLQVLLAKDPSQRFQSPAELQKALPIVKEALVSGSPLSAKELRSPGDQIAVQSPNRKPKKQSFRWLVALGLSASVLIAGWFFFFHGESFSHRNGIEAVPTEKSIAVLPFENISPNKDDTYFADGVQDEILNNLAKIAQLKVISRTSVMQYRADTKRDLRQIANALGVANVLEGTVRRNGIHVRVSTELVDARNDNTIWAGSYDRDLTDIFAIQSEIAQTVASRLSAQLSPEERKDIEEKPTNNLEAYDLYLQAKQQLGSNNGVVLLTREKENLSKAISLLEAATQKDRKFALAYCMIAKAHDYLYFDRINHTPERRALADAAVNEALRLRPDLAEVHLAVASHLYTCYRDFERARVQIDIAAQVLSNNSDLLQLTAVIDRVQGRWEKSTAGLERATTLDPRNPLLLATLSDNYWCLRRYRDYERILDRLIGLVPDQPLFPLYKAESAFAEKADLKGVLAAHEALPSSMKDDVQITWQRVFYPMCARDFAVAGGVVSKNPNEEMIFFGALVPRRIVALWLQLVQGNHPTMEDFGVQREQLYKKVEADRTDPFLLTALALADVALGHKEESMQEARRALEMRPISEDAEDGPIIAMNVAMVYAWADQPDLAFEQLSALVKMPSYWLDYGDLKTNPSWDPIRKDPRFDKLLAELAPRD